MSVSLHFFSLILTLSTVSLLLLFSLSRTVHFHRNSLTWRVQGRYSVRYDKSGRARKWFQRSQNEWDLSHYFCTHCTFFVHGLDVVWNCPLQSTCTYWCFRASVGRKLTNFLSGLQELDTDHSTIISLASEAGFVTVEGIKKATGWNDDRMQRAIVRYIVYNRSFF